MTEKTVFVQIGETSSNKRVTFPSDGTGNVAALLKCVHVRALTDHVLKRLLDDNDLYVQDKMVLEDGTEKFYDLEPEEMLVQTKFYKIALIPKVDLTSLVSSSNDFGISDGGGDSASFPNMILVSSDGVVSEFKDPQTSSYGCEQDSSFPVEVTPAQPTEPQSLQVEPSALMVCTLRL